MPGPTQEIHFAAPLGEWRLTRAEPDEDLRGLVVEYWEVEGAIDAFRETLLPNGCVEVMINLGPPHRVLSAGGNGLWERAWFSGLHERAIVIESLQGTHLVSARMHPIGAAALLGRRVAEAANSIVDLGALIGGGAADELRRDAVAATSPAERFAVLESFLRERRAGGDPAPPFVARAAERIDAQHGKLRVATLSDGLGISRKHLAVSFDRTVGVSMKAYAMIRRFVWTVARIQESTTVEWSTLAIEAGYSDQSHLVRDFQRVGAASPTEYLRRRAPDGSALLYDA